MMSVNTFRKKKTDRHKITMVTCYDACFAKILARTPIDLVLIGDSGSMVLHGHATTLNATVRHMVEFVEAVRRGAPELFLVADMPFLAHRMGLEPAMAAVRDLMAAGANAVKIEGVTGHEAMLSHIVQSGVPVMGHIGLTPQFIHQLGGYKVQGRDDQTAALLLDQAGVLEAAGAFAIVLECVPSALAAKITQRLGIPTIGIGAGPDTDGQVLVLHDLLGLNTDFRPRFVRSYLDGSSLVQSAVERYIADVTGGRFPTPSESYE